MKSDSTDRRLLVALIAVPILILGAHYCVARYVDFPVYWHAAQSLLSGRRDLYDPSFVFGAPDRMNYRYPPLFLVLFLPLALLPYKVAGYVWFAGKVGALVLAVHSLGRLGNRTVSGVAATVRFWAIPFFIATPYVLQDLHYGNVHLFVIALTVSALYGFEAGRMRLSAAALALAITIKIFPGFFLPYFFVQRRFRYVALTLAFLLAFNMAGGLYFGFGQNLELIGAWSQNLAGNRYFAELNTGTDHSLKGVLDRYFTHVPYELRPIDFNYPNINWVNWTGETIRAIRLAITGLAVALIALVCWRSSSREQRLLLYGLIACATVMLPPAVNYHYFEFLALPSVILSGFLLRRTSEPGTHVILVLGIVACLLSALPPLVPGRMLQRELQMYSPYFFSALALAAGLTLAWIQSFRRSAGEGETEAAG